MTLSINSSTPDYAVQPVGGFLKEVIFPGRYFCWNSTTAYKVELHSPDNAYTVFSGSCDNDPGFYQACGLTKSSGRSIQQFYTTNQLLCSELECKGNTDKRVSTEDCSPLGRYETCSNDETIKEQCAATSATKCKYSNTTIYPSQ